MASVPFAGDALSQNTAPGWAGWAYPTYNTGQAVGACNPNCTSASVTWKVPTLTADGRLVIWLGMSGNFSTSTDLNNCPGTFCLGQFGIVIVRSSGVFSAEAFWELECSNGGSSPIPCNAEQLVAETIAQGDIVTATMSCLSNCTPNNTSQTWTWTLTDVTQGWTLTNGSAGWITNSTILPLGLAVVVAVYEPDTNSIPAFSSTPMSNFTVNGSPVAAGAQSQTQGMLVKSVGGNTMFPSLPVGNGSEWMMCEATGTYAKGVNLCPGGAFRGGSGAAVQ